MASAEDLAQNFWTALCRHDVARAEALLADDTLFVLAGMPPAIGDEVLRRSYPVAAEQEPGSDLKTVACYEDVVIIERVGRLAGEPPDRRHLILTVARVNDGRIASWQDFVDPISS